MANKEGTQSSMCQRILVLWLSDSTARSERCECGSRSHRKPYPHPDHTHRPTPTPNECACKSHITTPHSHHPFNLFKQFFQSSKLWFFPFSFCTYLHYFVSKYTLNHSIIHLGNCKTLIRARKFLRLSFIILLSIVYSTSY